MLKVIWGQYCKIHWDGLEIQQFNETAREEQLNQGIRRMDIGEAEVRMFLKREQEQEVFLEELEGTMELGKVRMSLKREQDMFLAKLEGRMEMGEAELNMAALSLTVHNVQIVQ